MYLTVSFMCLFSSACRTKSKFTARNCAKHTANIYTIAKTHKNRKWTQCAFTLHLMNNAERRVERNDLFFTFYEYCMEISWTFPLFFFFNGYRIVTWMVSKRMQIMRYEVADRKYLCIIIRSRPYLQVIITSLMPINGFLNS